MKTPPHKSTLAVTWFKRFALGLLILALVYQGFYLVGRKPVELAGIFFNREKACPLDAIGACPPGKFLINKNQQFDQLSINIETEDYNNQIIHLKGYVRPPKLMELIHGYRNAYLPTKIIDVKEFSILSHYPYPEYLTKQTLVYFQQNYNCDTSWADSEQSYSIENDRALFYTKIKHRNEPEQTNNFLELIYDGLTGELIETNDQTNGTSLCPLT
ncbi:hypothetical protein IPJ72_00425 [Candidatus Peregrinibacteria bacterium]|nr:MAG: hypothetical protein IPJ72_00425 [Candidatus Peregrinibacteria bacterium]